MKLCPYQHRWAGRCRVGPTGKKDISILANRCLDCGYILPKFPGDLNYHEFRWVMRWNKRCDSRLTKCHDFVVEPTDRTTK